MDMQESLDEQKRNKSIFSLRYARKLNSSAIRTTKVSNFHPHTRAPQNEKSWKDFPSTLRFRPISIW